jgi:hypothetical protein
MTTDKNTRGLQVWARRGGYQYDGAELDRGQIFQMAGAVNDEKLLRLGYCEELPKKVKGSECGVCGAKFIDEATRGGHGNLRHKDRFLTPEEEDAQLDRIERINEQTAPLYLDQTAASRNER